MDRRMRKRSRSEWSGFGRGQASSTERNIGRRPPLRGHSARSVAEFISKIEAGLQELEETGYWLELLGESQIVSESRLTSLMVEVDELTAILVSSVKTAKKRRKSIVASGTVNGE